MFALHQTREKLRFLKEKSECCSENTLRLSDEKYTVVGSVACHIYITTNTVLFINYRVGSSNDPS